MSRTKINLPYLRGLWRTEVEIRIHDLRNRLRVVQEQQKENNRVLVTGVEGALQRAETAAGAEPRGLLQPASAWWTGSAITKAWESVHEAEAKLLQLETDDDVRSSLPRLLAWIQRAMDKSSQRRAHEVTLEEEMKKKGGKVDRTVVRQALEDVIGANNRRYGNLRAFRNNLIIVTGLLLALIVILAFWHLINPDLLKLCSVEGDKASCLTGAKPAGPDVALVGIVGAVGGLLAIAFGLADTRRPLPASIPAAGRCS